MDYVIVLGVIFCIYAACFIAAAIVGHCAEDKLDKDESRLILILLFWPIALLVVVGYGAWSLIKCFLNLRTMFKTAFGREEN